MIRRVSSRQRLVSWDSFDAAAHHSCYVSSDESSYEEGVVPNLDNVVGAEHEPTSTPASILSPGFPVILKRKRVPPRSDTAAAETLVKMVPESSLDLSSLTDDVVVQVCNFLSLCDVKSFAQVNHRLRTTIHREDYVWKQQAQYLWKVPMEMWNIEDLFRCDNRHDQQGQPSQLRSPVQWLSLASHQPLPTEIDASIFTPCRWSSTTTRTLRSRTIVQHVRRSSLQKELELVLMKDDKARAVRFLGPIGHGDRSIRANAPLPRPTKLLPHQSSLRRFWRSPPFFRRFDSSSSSNTEASASSSSSSSLSIPCKWQPFVAPLRLKAHPQVWNVAPRLVSYFEVEILPPSAALAAPAVPGRSHSRFRHFFQDDENHNWDRYHPPELVRSQQHHQQHSKPCVAVGLATSEFAMHTRMPGWDRHSWGFHGDDASLFHGAGTSVQNQYGPTFGCGDVVGCGVDWVHEHIFFTLNGQSLGVAFDVSRVPELVEQHQALYPVVGVDTHDLVRVNLTGPFCYDLQHHLDEHQATVTASLLQMKK